MIIKCEICEAISEQNKYPINNICPVCLHTGCLSIVKKPTKEQLRMLEELRKPTTALEYMEKQVHKHRMNYKRESARGVSKEMLENIEKKIGYYEAAVEALKR